MPNCIGTVKISPEFAVALRTSCCSFTDAYRCQTCGRLYWESGNGVFNRQNQKAFWDSVGGVRHEDMRANEQATYILAKIQQVSVEGGHEDKQSLVEELALWLRGRGHVKDCEANQGSICTCGVIEASNFISSRLS